MVQKVSLVLPEFGWDGPHPERQSRKNMKRILRTVYNRASEAEVPSARQESSVGRSDFE